jgi:hypothetical protein
MTSPQTSLAWRLLPREWRQRLLYTEQLATSLFLALPARTKKTLISQAQGVLRYPTFVETGTFMGETSLYAASRFTTVHTIELSPSLAGRAADRFASVPNVTVHQGDSGEVLRHLLPTIDTPCLFWLDGHYSGGITARGETDTPIVAELEVIAEYAAHPTAILIDDARVFGTDDAYPTLEEVIAHLRRINPDFKIGVTSDILWAAPVRILRFEWRVSPAGTVDPPIRAAWAG